MPSSIIQRRISEIVGQRYSELEIIENSRPDWLITTEGERLELDIFIPAIGLAFEVQGQQHYLFTPHFHKTYKDFEDQVRRDKCKREICIQFDVNLCEVCNEDELIDILAKLPAQRGPVPSYVCDPRWKSRLSYISFRTRGTRRRIGQCSHVLDGLRHSLQRDAILGKSSAPTLMRQFKHNYELKQTLQHKLIRKTLESAEYFEHLITLDRIREADFA